MSPFNSVVIGGAYVYRALKSVWGVDLYEHAMLASIHGSPLAQSEISPPVGIFPQPILGEKGNFYMKPPIITLPL
jgi:hypothetical protein